MVDAETAFTQVVAKRADAADWPHRTIGIAPPVDEVAAMKPGAVVIDPEACAGEFWAYLPQLAAAVPEAGLLVASATSEWSDRVRALRLGADDWIAKPAHPEEVLARVEAVVRRRVQAADTGTEDPMVAGELQIRPDHFQAYVGSQSVGLTRREYELLALLAAAGGKVLEREEIYRRVWGYAIARGDRSVDVFVRKLRQKLEAKSPGWRYIHTHFGIGYRFGAEAAGADETLAAPPAVGAPLAAVEAETTAETR
jgi:DNA-binding response OmpR family regulator